MIPAITFLFVKLGFKVIFQEYVYKCSSAFTQRGLMREPKRSLLVRTIVNVVRRECFVLEYTKAVDRLSPLTSS